MEVVFTAKCHVFYHVSKCGVQANNDDHNVTTPMTFLILFPRPLSREALNLSTDILLQYEGPSIQIRYVHSFWIYIVERFLIVLDCDNLNF